MPRFLSFVRITALGVAVFLLFAACGGDDGGVEVSMTEFAFTEAALTVGAGSEVTLAVSNDGTVIHNWSLVKLGQEIARESDLPEDPADRDDLYLVKVELDPGQSTTTTFTAPAAGTYQVICDIQAHFSAGMVGTLTVEG